MYKSSCRSQERSYRVHGRKKEAKEVVDLNDFEEGDYDDDVEVMHTQASVCGSTASSLHKPPKLKGPMDVFLTPEPEVVVRKRKGKQQKIDENDGAKKELTRRACKAFARWMYDAGIPFNAVNYPSFSVYVESQGQYGPGMKPPSYHEVRVPLLKAEVEDVKQLMKAHEAEWVTLSKRRLIDESEDEEDEIEFIEGDKNPNINEDDEDFENLQEEPEDDDY